MPIIHIREIDTKTISLWLPWWKVIHLEDCPLGEGRSEHGLEK